eukprot:COSAG02_NODE_8614_length_2505_cov_2.509975_2_plen_196_part_00
MLCLPAPGRLPQPSAPACARSGPSSDGGSSSRPLTLSTNRGVLLRLRPLGKHNGTTLSVPTFTPHFTTNNPLAPCPVPASLRNNQQDGRQAAQGTRRPDSPRTQGRASQATSASAHRRTRKLSTVQPPRPTSLQLSRHPEPTNPCHKRQTQPADQNERPKRTKGRSTSSSSSSSTCRSSSTRIFARLSSRSTFPR